MKLQNNAEIKDTLKTKIQDSRYIFLNIDRNSRNTQCLQYTCTSK